ncbi:MAG TPA: MBL fold metallo-hydrolase, partial [Candidatus Eisenbacteria bacterium]
VVSGVSTVVIDPPDGNMRDYLATLARLRGLSLTVLIPGHGAPHRGVAGLLDALIEHRRARESRIVEALAAGPLGEDALRERLYADTPGADPALAGRTLRAHLEKLEEEGRIARVPAGIALAG